MAIAPISGRCLTPVHLRGKEKEPEFVLLHTINRGDTLASIARFYGVREQELLQANPFLSPHYVYPGDKIVVPQDRRTHSMPMDVVQRREIVAPLTAADIVRTSRAAYAEATKGLIRELFDDAPHIQRMLLREDGGLSDIRTVQNREIAAVQDRQPIPVLADASATFQAILRAARALGGKLIVMDDKKLDQKFGPGALAVTTSDGKIYIKRSVWENPVQRADVLAHEAMHIVLFTQPSLFDPAISMAKRIKQARAFFKEIGMKPKMGELLIRNAGNLDQDPLRIGHHVQTAVNDIVILRERNGLPELSRSELKTLYRLNTQREGTLGITRYIDDGNRSLREILAFIERSPLKNLFQFPANWQAMSKQQRLDAIEAQMETIRNNVELALENFKQ